MQWKGEPCASIVWVVVGRGEATRSRGVGAVVRRVVARPRGVSVVVRRVLLMGRRGRGVRWTVVGGWGRESNS